MNRLLGSLLLLFATVPTAYAQETAAATSTVTFGVGGT